MSSSSCESESEKCLEKNFKQNCFVKILKKNPIVFEKSQIPKVKALKDQALMSMKNEFEVVFGEATDISKILKKINNMKTEVKKKHDVNRTGNKKIKMKQWESELLELMKSTTNPTMSTIPCKLFNQQ
jgi:predicted DNA binding protein